MSEQKERIKDLLRSSYPAGLCSYSLYLMGGLPNGRTRIYELRDDPKAPLDIETIPCDLAKHHAHEDHKIPGHVRFIWHFNPRPGAQLRLPGLTARRT